MLTYLVYVIEDLAVSAVLCGLVFACARALCARRGLVVAGALVAAGLVGALAIAIMKANTNWVDTGYWNIRFFVVAAVAFVAFLVCLVGPIRKSGPGAVAGSAALGIMACCRILYSLPEVLLYPFNFNVSSNNIISTDFAYRIIGYLLGLVVVVLAAVALYKALKALGPRPVFLSTAAIGLIVTLMQVMTMTGNLLARRLIPRNPALSAMVRWFDNNSELLTFVVIGVLVVLAVCIIALSLRDNEPYANPAEHRKNRARWRNRRRWSICLLVCLVVVGVTITAIKAYDSRGPELSPSEECEMHDGFAYIPFEQLEDGHLHRFTYETEAGMVTSSGYTTQGGVGIRFIIIKKPGSSAYGIGLDACEICGQTGYYERDGQVVCKLCDVVMNINTIGFKGGCNPIPIEYSIENGSIVIPLEGLAEFEQTFK